MLKGKEKALQPGTADLSAHSGELVSAPWTVAVTSEERIVKDIPAIRVAQLGLKPARQELLANQRVVLRVVAIQIKAKKPARASCNGRSAIPLSPPSPQMASFAACGQAESMSRCARGEVVSTPIMIVVKELANKTQVEPPLVKSITETKAVAPVPVEPIRPRLALYLARAKSLREQGQYAAALAELQ